MKKTVIHSAACHIYPGEYVPLTEEMALKGHRNPFHKRKVNRSPSIISELTDSYKIEIIIPGFKREDFLICVDENILSVRVPHQHAAMHKRIRMSSKLPEPNYEFCDRYIVLPENVDADFVSAEYKEGILCFYLPKANQVVRKLHTRIIVY